MINRSEILQTIAMIDQQHLDIRTITMGISLLDCADTDITRSCAKVYDKICRLAGRLVRTGEDIEAEFGIPIVNKRVSVTPISLVAAGTGARSYVPYAQALDRAEAVEEAEFVLNLLDGEKPFGRLHITRLLLVAQRPSAGNGIDGPQAAVEIVNRKSHRLLADSNKCRPRRRRLLCTYVDGAEQRTCKKGT